MRKEKGGMKMKIKVIKQEDDTQIIEVKREKHGN